LQEASRRLKAAALRAADPEGDWHEVSAFIPPLSPVLRHHPSLAIFSRAAEARKAERVRPRAAGGCRFIDGVQQPAVQRNIRAG